jgi:hypothetical protein
MVQGMPVVDPQTSFVLKTCCPKMPMMIPAMTIIMKIGTMEKYHPRRRKQQPTHLGSVHRKTTNATREKRLMLTKMLLGVPKWN